jgi:hypothetical protein
MELACWFRVPQRSSPLFSRYTIGPTDVRCNKKFLHASQAASTSVQPYRQLYMNLQLENKGLLCTSTVAIIVDK